MEWVGEDNIASFVGSHTILGPVVSSLIGLIPNCGASVIITELYLNNANLWKVKVIVLYLFDFE